MKVISFITSVSIIILCLLTICHAQGLSSASFRITTDVLSSGGLQGSTANYDLQGTLGQPTPIPQTVDLNPYASTHDLCPGFWFTTDATDSCTIEVLSATFGTYADEAAYHPACDMDMDGDVDGVDVWMFSAYL